MGLADKISDALDIVGSIVQGTKDVLENYIFDPFQGLVVDTIAGVIEFLIYTPAPAPPNGYIFGKPTNSYWGAIYDFYWQEAYPVGLLILALAYFVRQLAATWGMSPGSSSRGMKKNLINGLFMLHFGWYISVILLRTANGLVQLFAPDPTAIKNALGGLALSGALASGILSAVGGTVNLTLLFLAVAINVLRVILTLIIVGSLPVLIAFSYGQIPVLRNLGTTIYTKLPTLAFMTFPTAIGMEMTFLVLNSGFSIPGGSLTKSAFAIVPALIGIFVPILMYNAELYQMGGRAATRAFGATASVTTGQSLGGQTIGKARSASENLKESKYGTVGGKAKGKFNEVRTDPGSRTDFATDLGDDGEASRTADNVEEDFEWGKYGGENAGNQVEQEDFNFTSDRDEEPRNNNEIPGASRSGGPDTNRFSDTPTSDTTVSSDSAQGNGEPVAEQNPKPIEEYWDMLENPGTAVSYAEELPDEADTIEEARETFEEKAGTSLDAVYVESEDELVQFDQDSSVTTEQPSAKDEISGVEYTIEDSNTKSHDEGYTMGDSEDEPEKQE
jgi:hypothetical protein